MHVIDSGLAGWLLGLSAAKISSRDPAVLTEFGHLVETSLQAVRNQANVQVGQRVLITGAGGGIGTLAAQLAKARGASVTGVCGPGSACGDGSPRELPAEMTIGAISGGTVRRPA